MSCRYEFPLLVCAPACLYSQFITSVSYKQYGALGCAFIYRLQFVWIIDTGQKLGKEKTLQEVLLDVIEVFPKYDPESAEGINKAIEDMEETLGQLASFKEKSVVSLNRSCILRFAISCISHLLFKIP